MQQSQNSGNTQLLSQAPAQMQQQSSSNVRIAGSPYSSNNYNTNNLTSYESQQSIPAGSNRSSQRTMTSSYTENVPGSQTTSQQQQSGVLPNIASSPEEPKSQETFESDTLYEVI